MALNFLLDDKMGTDGKEEKSSVLRTNEGGPACLVNAPEHTVF